MKTRKTDMRIGHINLAKSFNGAGDNFVRLIEALQEYGATQYVLVRNVALAKRLLWQGVGVEDMMRRENKIFSWIGNQPDAKEGVVSFLEKRTPEWKLRPSRDKPTDLL